MTTLGGSVAEGARRGDPVALCQAMVAIPSVNPELEPGGAGEEALARQCADWLAGWGYEDELIQVAPGRWNLVARRRWGDGGTRLLLNGHLDTVDVGDPAQVSREVCRVNRTSDQPNTAAAAAPAGCPFYPRTRRPGPLTALGTS